MLARLFLPAPPDLAKKRKALLEQMAAQVGSEFNSDTAMRQYLMLIMLPKSGAWRYQLNGKSGTTFVLNLLFELEHAVPFSTQVSGQDTGNQHPDFALFQQIEAGLLGTALDHTDSWESFCDFPGLRLATVRNPYLRAVSSFRYLCRSHRVGDRRFLSERLRLNALAGLDFNKDSETARGFGLFLSYVRDYYIAFGGEQLDAHWRPQNLHIRPDIYRPDLIGRTDEIDTFAKVLAEKLDRPLPKNIKDFRRNATCSDGEEDLLVDPASRRIIEEIYAADFEIFEYDLRS